MEDEEEKKSGGKSSVSTKRSRAAAIHNQSERVIIHSTIFFKLMIGFTCMTPSILPLIDFIAEEER